MHVIIVGAGVGGLALALHLHEKGIACTVYERAEKVRELGVGINVLPHSIKHLAALGLLPALDDVAIRTKELIYATGRGQPILRQPRGLDAGYDVPQFSIHRGKLQKVLHDAVVNRLGRASVIADRRLTAHTADDTGVSATFTDAAGATHHATGDVLVAADGIHSAVRKGRNPGEGAPDWNGLVMYRGATWTTPFADGRTMVIAGGMQAKLVLYPIHNSPDRPGETLMNWAVCGRAAEPGAPLTLRDDWQKEGTLDDVMPWVEGKLHVDALDIVDLIHRTDAFYVYPMCDREPLDHWTEGRVTLLGDAAHPMYPVGSNGASQAILDGVSLAGHLAQSGVAGLAAYDAERRPATAEIVRLNRKGGPERVIDLVEERAPDGFDRLCDVVTDDELRAIVGDYQEVAGFTTDAVNQPASA
ncbi:MAG: flavin-dependent oxidoreductase [Pseudomonadota bacterium]